METVSESAETAKSTIGNISESHNYVGSSNYGGNTLPGSLLEDAFKESDSHRFHTSVLKNLKKVMKEEYGLNSKLHEIFDKAMASKYCKEYAALNQALPLLKKSFNISSCDVLLAANELILSDEFKTKWIDVANLGVIKAELEERYFPKDNKIR